MAVRCVLTLSGTFVIFMAPYGLYRRVSPLYTQLESAAETLEQLPAL